MIHSDNNANTRLKSHGRDTLSNHVEVNHTDIDHVSLPMSRLRHYGPFSELNTKAVTVLTVLLRVRETREIARRRQGQSRRDENETLSQNNRLSHPLWPGSQSAPQAHWLPWCLGLAE
jgi:hypothetical protein